MPLYTESCMCRGQAFLVRALSSGLQAVMHARLLILRLLSVIISQLKIKPENILSYQNVWIGRISLAWPDPLSRLSLAV